MGSGVESGMRELVRGRSGALDILKEWCVGWILIPDVRSYLDGIWTFYARPREDAGMSYPEFRESLIKEHLKMQYDISKGE